MSQSKRVFIISHTESHLTKRGKRHPNLANFLSEKNYDIVYVSSSFNHAEKTKFSLEEIDQAKREVEFELILFDSGSYETNFSPRRVLFHRRFSRKLNRYLRKELKDGDIIVSSSRPPEVISCIGKIRKKHNIRTLLDIRDGWPESLRDSEKISHKLFCIYCDYLQKNTVKSFDHFFHICDLNLEWLDRFAPGRESQFLPLGFDQERWKDCRPKPLKSDNKKLRMIYVGTLAKAINIMPLVRSVGDMQDRVELTLVGCEPTDEKYAELMEYIKNEKPQNIQVNGMLPSDRVVSMFGDHDVAAIPVVQAALPNKVFDAIASYTPMMGFGDDHTTQFIRERDLGWVSSYDHDDIIKTIDSITPEGLLQKSDQITKVRDEFTHKALFKKIEEAISAQAQSFTK